jgi:hypothetical protein
VQLVEFFADTNKIGQATALPYSFIWSNAPRGDFALTAVTHDDWTE